MQIQTGCRYIHSLQDVVVFSGSLVVGYIDGQVHLLPFDVHHPDRKPAVVKIHEDVDHLTVSDLLYVSSKLVEHQAYFVLVSQLI